MGRGLYNQHVQHFVCAVRQVTECTVGYHALVCKCVFVSVLCFGWMDTGFKGRGGEGLTCWDDKLVPFL